MQKIEVGYDDLGAARGIMFGLLLGSLFWLAVGAVVAGLL